MATAMLAVRAVYLSEDFEPYWRVHRSRTWPLAGSWPPLHRIETKQLHPHQQPGEPGHVSEYGDPP